MSFNIRNHMPLVADSKLDGLTVEKGMQRIEVALLVGATCVAVVLFSVVSVLIHLS